MSFYPVDARGLVAQSPLGDATHGSPGGVGMYSGASTMANTNNFQKSQDTLYALAADTGGKALLDNNDLSQGIVQAQKAITSYYIIGYYSANTALDGSFRRIKITLGGRRREAGLPAGILRRQGVQEVHDGGQRTAAAEDALMLGDPITELTIAMEVNYFQLNSAEYFVPVVVKIPGSELALARKGGAEHTLIDFIGEVKDEYNVTVPNVRDKVDIKLSGATAAQLAKQPIQYDTGFTLLPGTYSFKFLARDAETGRIGTYLKKFVVPNLNKEQKRIPISSVVLSGQRVDMKDSLFTAGKDKDAGGESADPERTEADSERDASLQPEPRHVCVPAGVRARRQATMQPLVAFVTFYRGQTKAFETAPLPVTEGMDPKSKAVPLRFSLALNKLPPGRYNCQVTVIDPTGQKAAFWQAPVMLVQ